MEARLVDNRIHVQESGALNMREYALLLSFLRNMGVSGIDVTTTTLDDLRVLAMASVALREVA